jgi:predicted TIM-barrel fold metal-dependent hydrolase
MNLIDTHLHLIFRDRFGYGWTAGIPALATGDFLPADARAAAGGRIAGSIFMEAAVDDADYRAEARHVASLVRAGDLLGQIASCRPEAEEGFADWLEECGDLGVVGFRRVLHVVPDDLSRSEVFRANIRRLAARGLPFDMCFLARQLPVALELARACPEVQFVLDHCGVPDIAGGAFDPWRADIAALAELPNVAVKLSGLTAYCAPGTVSAATLAPWVDHVLSCFGTGRAVWGSDWPVVNLGAGLGVWLDITEGILAALSPDEALDVAARNAARIYRVGPV